MSDSMLLTDDHPVDPDDELLVAYLDGELDEHSRKSVESRLVRELNFQKRLQALQTGWEWLDELPIESTDEQLVESTIELVVADFEPKSQSRTAWIGKHRRILLLAGSMALAFLIAVVGVYLYRQRELRIELQELAIAEHQDAYKLGTHFELFDRLASDSQWQDMIAALQRIGRRPMRTESWIASVPLDERRPALQALPSQDREQLAALWKTYSEFSESTKQELRRTAQLVAQQPNPQLIRETMMAASIWMESLDDDLRDRINSRNADESELAISEAIQLTMAKLEQDSGRLISDATSDKIFLWLQAQLTERLAADPSLDEQKQKLAEAYSRWEFTTAPEKMAQTVMLLHLIDNGRSRRLAFMKRFFGPRPPGGPGPGGPGPGPGPAGRSGSDRDSQDINRPGEDERKDSESGRDQQGRQRWGRFPRTAPISIPTLTDEELLDLYSILDESDQQDLRSLASLSTEMIGQVGLTETLRLWVEESFLRNLPRSKEEPQSAFERYQQRDDRNVLDLKSPEEISERVLRERSWFSPPRP